MEVTLKINGKPVKVTVAPDEMLLETLRGSKTAFAAP